MKTPEEELLENQLARCAEALNACLDGATSARGRNADARKAELFDAARLMGASARLANALSRLRLQSLTERRDERSKNRGSNGRRTETLEARRAQPEPACPWPL